MSLDELCLAPTRLPESVVWDRQAPRRLPGWDYAGPGHYFITFVTWHRRRSLAMIRNGRPILTPAGIAVQESWQAIPAHYPGVILDEFVVMPDHVHAIVVLDQIRRGAIYRAPETVWRSGDLGSGMDLVRTDTTISVVVGTWKAASARAIRRSGYVEDGPIWQRNFHERVIRSAVELDRFRAYIRGNPRRASSS